MLFKNEGMRMVLLQNPNVRSGGFSKQNTSVGLLDFFLLCFHPLLQLLSMLGSVSEMVYVGSPVFFHHEGIQPHDLMVPILFSSL